MNIKFDESFNWLAILKDLAAGMPLDLGDYVSLSYRAHGWPTCACGQLCARLPRTPYSQAPKDKTLKFLGVDFARHVDNRQWRLALRDFRAIEARTNTLLNLPAASCVGHARTPSKAVDRKRRATIITQ